MSNAQTDADLVTEIHQLGDELFKSQGLRGVEHEEVELAGLPTHVVYGGNPEGRTVVLLHGAGAAAGLWFAAAGGLGERHRLVIPDVPGFGESALPDWQGGAAKIEGYTRWMNALVEHVGGRVVLVGQSYGGFLTIRQLLTNPAPVDGALICGGLGLGREQPAVAGILALPLIGNLFAATVMKPSLSGSRMLAKTATMHYDRIPRTEDLVRYLYLPTLRPGFHRWLISVFQDASTPLGIRDEWIFTDQLAAVKTPLLLLWGDHDAAFPLKYAQKAKARLPLAELEVIEDASHAPFLDAAEIFNRHVLAWIERLREEGSAAGA